MIADHEAETLLHRRTGMLNYYNAIELFYYDPHAGVLRNRVNRPPGACAGDVAGWLSWNRYQVVSVGKKMYRAHRVIWLMMFGQWPSGEIDHIDGDRTNNRIENLRDVRPAENRRNQKRPRHNASGEIGVGWHKETGKWRAYIQSDGRYVHLGLHESRDAAVAARRDGESRYGFHHNHGRPA